MPSAMRWSRRALACGYVAAPWRRSWKWKCPGPSRARTAPHSCCHTPSRTRTALVAGEQLNQGGPRPGCRPVGHQRSSDGGERRRRAAHGQLRRRVGTKSSPASSSTPTTWTTLCRLARLRAERDAVQAVAADAEARLRVLDGRLPLEQGERRRALRLSLVTGAAGDDQIGAGTLLQACTRSRHRTAFGVQRARAVPRILLHRPARLLRSDRRLCRSSPRCDVLAEVAMSLPWARCLWYSTVSISAPQISSVASEPSTRVHPVRS